MRNIKFKGKKVNGGDWVESMTISNGTIERKKHRVFFELGENYWVGVIPESVGQFTGLCDKNGKEIYEGDIVSNGNQNYSISFSLRYGWVLTRGNFSYSVINETMDSSIDKGIVDGVAVIGNVYDNPELLD